MTKCHDAGRVVPYVIGFEQTLSKIFSTANDGIKYSFSGQMAFKVLCIAFLTGNSRLPVGKGLTAVFLRISAICSHAPLSSVN